MKPRLNAATIREISTRLDVVYDMDKRQYRIGMGNDKSLAQDLNVPVAFVRQVRETYRKGVSVARFERLERQHAELIAAHNALVKQVAQLRYVVRVVGDPWSNRRDVREIENEARVKYPTKQGAINGQSKTA